MPWYQYLWISLGALIGVTFCVIAAIIVLGGILQGYDAVRQLFRERKTP